MTMTVAPTGTTTLISSQSGRKEKILFTAVSPFSPSMIFALPVSVRTGGAIVPVQNESKRNLKTNAYLFHYRDPFL